MKKILKTTGIVIFGACCALILTYLLAYLSGKPEIGKNYSLELYDNQGEIFYASVNEKSGEWVEIEDVSEDFLHAIVDMEDQYFFYHPGFDPIGIARAIFIDIKNGDLSQGASTISQQYVKNLFLTNEKTWERKIREAWLTMQVETHYDKEEILEGYVNTVYFGAGIYGIQNAAKYFFNKDASDLTLQEASLLAGIVNGPELYSPIRNPELVKERQALVLDSMYEHQHITKIQYDQALAAATPLNLSTDTQENQTLGYFKDQVLSELEALGFDENDCLKNGLKVYTTLDNKVQMEVSKALQSDSEETVQNAVVVLEPGSGALLAMAGGRDYGLSQYNRATMAQRQMASTVKPLLYYEALVNGLTPSTKFVSEKTTFRLSDSQTYSPSNYNDLYPDKEITMLNAIAASDNIYAVKTHLFLGEQTLALRLRSFGYKDVEAVPSLALGSVETSPLQLANMYNCIASLGTYYEDYCIERIEDQNGQILYQHKDHPQNKLDQDICLILSQMLTAPFDTHFNTTPAATMLNYRSDITFAAKTGTSDWDSWIVAYNPQILICVWTGFDENEPLEDTYKYTSRDIFQSISSAVLDPKNAHWYEPTKNIVQIPIDPVSGNFSPDGSIYWFYQPVTPIRKKNDLV